MDANKTIYYLEKFKINFKQLQLESNVIQDMTFQKLELIFKNNYNFKWHS